MLLFKFTIFFSLSFLILTIPVKGKKLFYILDTYTSPLTSQLGKNFQGTADLGKQLFINSNPRHSIYNDQVKKKQAAILKERKKHIRDTEEDISIFEQSELSSIIEESSKN